METDRYRAFVTEATDLVVGYGGSISGEHGDGQSRAELLPRMYGYVSIACAERVMAPAIRRSDHGTVVVADGFSCRTQIKHATGRRALHLAEVLDAVLDAARPRAPAGV